MARCGIRKNWLYFRNPFGPSWGEPYTEILARMRPAMRDAAGAAVGHEAVIVTHQLPIWMARSDAEGRRMLHDPRKRQCTLGSVTSFTYIDAQVTSVSYAEPAAELLRPHRPRSSSQGPDAAAHCGPHCCGFGRHADLASCARTGADEQDPECGPGGLSHVPRNLTRIPPEQRQELPTVSGPASAATRQSQARTTAARSW